MNFLNLAEKVRLYHLIRKNMSSFEWDNWQGYFSLDYTHNSTAIEGNRLTIFQAKVLLEDKFVPEALPLRDVLEVYAHDEAFNFIKQELKYNREITESFIQEINERVRFNENRGGNYRKVNVYIRGATTIPPEYQEVPAQMEQLLVDFKNKSDVNPIEKAAWLHAQFVKIHPFVDGNGRTARLLMNYSLMKDGYITINIKKETRDEYFKYLDIHASVGNLGPFSAFIYKLESEELSQFIEMYKQHII